jgi:hypothetical protein
MELTLLGLNQVGSMPLFFFRAKKEKFADVIHYCPRFISGYPHFGSLGSYGGVPNGSHESHARGLVDLRGNRLLRLGFTGSLHRRLKYPRSH